MCIDYEYIDKYRKTSSKTANAKIIEGVKMRQHYRKFFIERGSDVMYKR
jgi:hypothetical protein